MIEEKKKVKKKVSTQVTLTDDFSSDDEMKIPVNS